MKHISVQDFNEINEQSDYILLDVRSNDEYELANIGGVLIPLDQLQTRYHELDLTKPIYCLCHHGMRSAMACQILDQVGARETFNISGGIEAYSLDIDPTIRRY